MATLPDILNEFRSALAELPTSRDAAQTFQRHETAEAFEMSPLAGADGFSIMFENPVSTGSFGLATIQEKSTTVTVKLGHFPGASEEERIDALASDIERISDLFESRAWSTLGVQAVFFERSRTDKEDGLWWVTEMEFLVVYLARVFTA